MRGSVISPPSEDPGSLSHQKIQDLSAIRRSGISPPSEDPGSIRESRISLQAAVSPPHQRPHQRPPVRIELTHRAATAAAIVLRITSPSRSAITTP